jgi:hypothetical protein
MLRRAIAPIAASPPRERLVAALRELEVVLARAAREGLAPAAAARVLDGAGSAWRGLLDGEPAAAAELAAAWAQLERQVARFGDPPPRAATRDGAIEAARAAVMGLDLGVVYDPDVGLLRAGYDVAGGTPDERHHRCLASAARLASYLAIARAAAPIAHWHRLDRGTVALDGAEVLAAEDGRITDYLAPNLFLRCPPESLLGGSCAAAARGHVARYPAAALAVAHRPAEVARGLAAALAAGEIARVEPGPLSMAIALASLADHLGDGALVRRFHAHPIALAAEFLLDEPAAG